MYLINDSNITVHPPVRLRNGETTTLNIQPKGRVKMPNMAVLLNNDLPVRQVTEAEMMGRPTAETLAKAHSANAAATGD